MKSIVDELTDRVADKLYDIINYSLSKVIKPDIEIDKVTDLSLENIKQIKNKYDIEGIIIDVDETLRKELKDIPKCNKKWIESLKGYIKISIVSNGIDKSLEKYFKNIGIDYIQFAQKPLKKNFIKACKNMNVSPDKVLVIGDKIIEDVIGGKVNKMKTLLIKEVEEDQR